MEWLLEFTTTYIKMSFYYFAYGSNLLKKRIHINNPTAEFIDIGRLSNHSLDFSKYSENWCGAVATIVPTEGVHVWGAIWKLCNENLLALDKQEGVESKTYFSKTATVRTSTDSNIECRTYQLTELPPPSNNEQDLPAGRRPSVTYLDCIIKGAIECKLPKEYIEKLKKIPNNGLEATPELREQLRL